MPKNPSLAVGQPSGTSDSSQGAAEEQPPWETVLASLPEAIAEIDSDRRFVRVSAGSTHNPGHDLEEMLAGIHPEDREPMRLLVDQGLEKRRSGTGRFRTPAPSEATDWRWHECTVAPYRDGDHEPRVAFLSRDISDRIAAERRNTEDEFRYRDLAENASDLIVEIDSNGRILYISPNAKKLTDRPAREIIGTLLADFQDHWIGLDSTGTARAEGMSIVEGLQETLALGGTGRLMHFRYAHPDGSERRFEMQARSFTREDGSIHVVVIARDVTERIRAEEELRESEERYRIVATITHDLISEIRSDGRIVYISPTIEEVLGYTPESLIGTLPWKLIHPDDVESIRPLVEKVPETPSKTITFPPFRSRHVDGSWHWLEGDGVEYVRRGGETRMLIITRDITARRNQEARQQALEEQVRQAQKLEGLGVMAGGIAHDFNNFLTPILGEAGLALEDLPDDSLAHPRLEKIQAAARRAALLTSQMLAYAGKKTLAMSPIHLSTLVEEMAQLMASGVARTVYIDEELPADLPLIEGDPAQLTQVVMNLITNAAEAVIEDEGAISIRTGTIDSSELDPRKLVLGDANLEPGTYVFLEVRDTGAGMSPATQARIFDPFFTTKFAGRGLGLAAVLGIVRGHRGAIEIDSGPTRGTSFRIFFPITDKHTEDDAVSVEKTLDWEGKGTVLIVDDDEAILELARETLQRCGLEAITAVDGRSGIDAFAKNPGSIDAVLLDRTMPGLSGEEVVAELRKLRPDVRIVLASGYSEERASVDFQSDDLAGFLQKPFIPEDLVTRIREALEH